MSSHSALWRHCKRFHQDLGVETYSERSEQDKPDPDEFVMGQECQSDSDLEETLTMSGHVGCSAHTRTDIAHTCGRNGLTPRKTCPALFIVSPCVVPVYFCISSKEHIELDLLSLLHPSPWVKKQFAPNCRRNVGGIDGISCQHLERRNCCRTGVARGWEEVVSPAWTSRRPSTCQGQDVHGWITAALFT